MADRGRGGRGGGRGYGGGGGGNRGGDGFRRGGGGGGGGGQGYHGGGGGGGGGAPRGGRGGFGGSAPFRGGRPTGQTTKLAPYNLPKNHSMQVLSEPNSKFGWKNVVLDKGFPVPERSMNPGTVACRHIPLTTNHLAATLKLPGIVHQYEIDIDKTEDRKAASKKNAGKATGRGPAQPSPEGKDPPRNKLWMKIVKASLYPNLLQQNQNRPFATDFMRSIYSTYPLHINEEGYLTDLSEIEGEPSGHGRAVYVITVKLVDQIRTAGELMRCLNDTKGWFAARPGAELPLNFIKLDQVLNIALKTMLNQRFTGVGRISFYPEPKDEYDLGGGLVNWPGFSTVYTLGWKPFINIDVANTAFIKGQKVYDAIYALNCGDPSDCSNFNTYSVREAMKLLKGCMVEYPTKGGSKLSGRITDVLNEPPRKQTFTTEKGPTNVEEYFKTEYKQIMKCPKGICLQIRGKSVVPAEICTIKKGQAFNAKLNEAQTSSMIKVTAKPPAERRQKIEQTIMLLNFTKDDVMKEFGLSVDNKLHKLPEQGARVLPMPTLVYASAGAQDQQMWVVPPKDGVWNMFEKSELNFIKAAHKVHKQDSIKWGVINFSRTDRNLVFDFVSKLCNIANVGGLSLGNPDTVMNNYYQGRPNDISKFMKGCAEKDLKFVMVIMEKDAGTYAQVKATSEIYMEKPVLTQCVLSKNVSKCEDATVQNLLFKINAKLGGVNYFLHCPDQPWTRIDILHCPVLIIGADVTHPGLDSKYPSLAAVTASIDRTGMPYQMHIQAQRKAEKGAAEVIQGLAEIVKGFIQRFITTTGCKPRKILYYRDGVGDSQFGEVLNTEMMAIRTGCDMVGSFPRFCNIAGLDFKVGETSIPGKYEPKITFVSVQKRHHVRFFVDNPKDGVGRGGNAPPGVVVDTDIVSPILKDFYLLSHLGIQGTSRPTRYVILWDDSDFSMNELEMLTFYLCFMYTRCNRSVSYPAPTYYAHLGATRAKVYATTLSDAVLEDLVVTNREINRQVEFKKLFPMHFV